MSVLGIFGTCSQSNYNELVELIKSGESAKTEELIKKIYGEVENSAVKLENDKCSGEYVLCVQVKYSLPYFTILIQSMEWMFDVVWKASAKNGVI